MNAIQKTAQIILNASKELGLEIYVEKIECVYVSSTGCRTKL